MASCTTRLQLLWAAVVTCEILSMVMSVWILSCYHNMLTSSKFLSWAARCLAYSKNSSSLWAAMFAAETSFKLFIAWCTACKVQCDFYFRLFLNLRLVREFIFEDTLTRFRMGFLISTSSQMLYNICLCVFVWMHHSCFFGLTCHFFIHYYVIL